MYNMGMKTISSTDARKHISTLFNEVREMGEVFAVGRRSNLEVLIMKFPSQYNSKLSDITNVNSYSRSFDFLAKESELYSLEDLKKRYL